MYRANPSEEKQVICYLMENFILAGDPWAECGYSMISVSPFDHFAKKDNEPLHSLDMLVSTGTLHSSRHCPSFYVFLFFSNFGELRMLNATFRFLKQLSKGAKFCLQK